MTIVKRGPYKGSLAGKVGRAMRREGIIRSGPTRVTTAMVPAESVPVVDPEREMHLRSLVARFSGDLNRKAMKVRYLALISPGPDQLRPGPAWRALHPRSKATAKSCIESASVLYAEILADLGPNPAVEDILALIGIHVGSIGKGLREASEGAMFVREFYDSKASGKDRILTGKERPDYLVRLRAIELQMKMLGLGKPGDVPQSVVVNIVSYLPGPVAEQRPWPGGGRAIDGRLQDTVGPNSPAARAALPAHAVALPDGALGEPKNSP